MNHSRNTVGFTLIEMMVVVAVAGILAAVAYTSYSDTRAQARDRIRMSQLDQLQVAIELYKDQNGVYPLAGCSRGSSWVGSDTYDGSHPFVEGCSEYIVGLVPDFLDELPREVGDGHNKGYTYRTDGTRSAYKVLAHHSVERLLVSGFGHPYARYLSSCMGTFPAGERDVYAIYSEGAECW